MKNTLLTLLSVLTLSLALNSCASTAGASSKQKVKPYLSDLCLVTDTKIDSLGTPFTRVYNGQEVKFCCLHCIEIFEKSPEPFLAKLK